MSGSEIPSETLTAIFATGEVLTPDGQPVPLRSGISVVNANALYGAVRARRPQLVVEIGMAHGISSLAIATALHENGDGGRLISIDPFQHARYQGVGVANLSRAGLSGCHTLLEQPDYLALPGLLAEGAQVDLGYIDGYHTFDYTLLDFFYLDRLLPVGGVVGFNDVLWRAVRKVIGFVKTHRKYQELKLAAPDYHSHRPFVTTLRRLTRLSKSDRYFEKLAAWEPRYDYFRPF